MCAYALSRYVSIPLTVLALDIVLRFAVQRYFISGVAGQVLLISTHSALKVPIEMRMLN